MIMWQDSYSVKLSIGWVFLFKYIKMCHTYYNYKYCCDM